MQYQPVEYIAVSDVKDQITLTVQGHDETDIKLEAYTFTITVNNDGTIVVT